MNPWDIVKWCCAILVLLGTGMVVGFTCVAGITMVWTLFGGKKK